MKLISWNVNGLRAIAKKGFQESISALNPDLICLQEIKAEANQLPDDIRYLAGYQAWFNPSRTRKGYSGTAVYSRVEPLSVEHGLGIERFDVEGRTQILTFPEFVLYNIYYPNGKAGPERLQYKLEFYEAFLDHVQSARAQNKSVVVCGDVNTAHQEIDLARPKQNEQTSGFLRVERDWLDRFTETDLVDTFRLFNQDGGHYTWWDYITQARSRNVGWRIDYFYVSPELIPQIKSATIHPEYFGSDHCPIGLELDFSTVGSAE